MNALPNPFDDIAPALPEGQSEVPVPVAAEGSPAKREETQYIPELFSSYAARRCLPIISPPLPKVVRSAKEWLIDPKAFFEAIEPPPLCLQQHISPEFTDAVTQRVPRESLIRALLDVAGDLS